LRSWSHPTGARPDAAWAEIELGVATMAVAAARKHSVNFIMRVGKIPRDLGIPPSVPDGFKGDVIKCPAISARSVPRAARAKTAGYLTTVSLTLMRAVSPLIKSLPAVNSTVCPSRIVKALLARRERNAGAPLPTAFGDVMPLFAASSGG
jgi:hypothetical protein